MKWIRCPRTSSVLFFPIVGEDLSSKFRPRAEIQEQPHLHFGRLEIIDELRLVFLPQRLGCLQLHDHAPIDEQIGVVPPTSQSW